MKKKQFISAFTLIEVLVALMLVSVTLGLLLQAIQESRIEREKTLQMEAFTHWAFSVGNACRWLRTPGRVKTEREHWQQWAQQVVLDAQLQIEVKRQERTWLYTIVLHSPKQGELVNFQVRTRD